MTSSGKAKKARRHVFRDMKSIEDLPQGQQKYIKKKADRYLAAISGETNPAFEAREFPCQVINGKKVLIPVDAQPEYNEEDGKWYLDDKLIMSSAAKKSHKQPHVETDDATDAAITRMEPEVLGE